MRTAIYVIWGLVIVAYFLLGLWSMLEKAGDKVNKKAKHEAADIFKQLIFVIGIVGLCFVVDLYLIDSQLMPLMPSFVPREFLQVILLPALLYIGSLMVGGSEPIRVEKGRKGAKGKTQKHKKIKKKKRP